MRKGMAWYSVVLACFMRGIISPTPPKDRTHARMASNARGAAYFAAKGSGGRRTQHRSLVFNAA
jgi:hypothetical protein